MTLWLGSDEEMEVVATTGERKEKAPDTPTVIDDLLKNVRPRFQEGPVTRAHQTGVGLTQNVSGMRPTARESLVVPLRIRGELTGAMMVACNTPLPQESKNA